MIADIVDARELAEKINRLVGEKRVESGLMDLGDLTSIDDFVSGVGFPRVDFLVNNAGVMGIPQLKYTKSGYETHFGVNYIGHFYLTYNLMPLLKKS